MGSVEGDGVECPVGAGAEAVPAWPKERPGRSAESPLPSAFRCFSAVSLIFQDLLRKSYVTLCPF